MSFECHHQTPICKILVDYKPHTRDATSNRVYKASNSKVPGSDIGDRFIPHFIGGQAAQSTARHIIAFEVNAAVAARHAGLVRGFGKCGPEEHHWDRWC